MRRGGNGSSAVSVCVFCMSVMLLTFESLDLESSFLVRRFRISGLSSYIKDIGCQGRAHGSSRLTACQRVCMSQCAAAESWQLMSIFAGGPTLTERQSC